jgi:inorganic triphosphatase YgiF
MTSPKELEIKLELAPVSLRRLKKIPLIHSLRARPKQATEVSVYFDTPKRKLRKKGLLLRVRRIGGRYVQTIKASGNSRLFERDEWEAKLASAEPDLSLASGTALEPLASGNLRRKLKPLFETRVRRTVYPVANNGCAIALMLDRGTIRTGAHSAPLCEIELELKQGDMAGLFDVAREITHALPAQLALESKSERGYELVDGEQDAPVRATPIDLAAGTSTRDAFKMIGRACLKQALRNKPALLKGDPEGVHQMRVGLRRLRAAMSLFADLLHDPQTAAIKAELKWLAAELAPARDLEVLTKRVATAAKKQHARWHGVPSLSRELVEKREAALTRAQEAVTSARFRTLTLETAAWLEIGQWTNPQDDLVRDLGNIPIEIYAAEELTRRWRKIRKKGRALAQLDGQSRHRLRIQVKKLRYATEFFANVFPGKRASKQRRKFVPALARLQDGLGDLNDIAVHEHVITSLGAERRRSSPKRAFAAGVLAGHENARLDAAMAAATKGFADLADAKPFWR